MNRHLTLTILFALLFLFLIQMIGTLVESIYLLDLLNTSLDAKAAGVLFLFSPALLLALRRYSSAKDLPGWMLAVVFAVLLAGRAAGPYLGTFGRLIAAGAAAAAGLLLLPVLLARYLKAEQREDGLIPGGGLALAVALSILLRAMNHGLDVSLGVEAGWIGGLLAAVLGVLIWRAEGEAGEERLKWSLPEEADDAPRSSDVSRSAGGVISAAVGLCAALALVYFAFSSPWVIARWTQGGNSNFAETVIPLIGIYSAGGFLHAVMNSTIFTKLSSNKPVVILVNIAFVLVLAGLIFSHRISFPSTPGEVSVIGFQYDGKPYIPDRTVAQNFLLILLVFLQPILYLDTAILSGSITRAHRSLCGLGAGFTLGMLVFVLLVFILIFTNVWGYVKPVSTPFRNQFWLPFAVASIIMAFGASFNTPTVRTIIKAPVTNTRLWPSLATIIFLSISAIIGILSIKESGAFQTVPRFSSETNQITVMTYNIQQGAGAAGEKAYRQQLEVIRSIHPDVLALQESDTARISTNNNDYVNYFARELGYRTYYGPKTVAGTFGTAILIRGSAVSDVLFTFSDQDENATNRIFTMLLPGGVRIYNVHPDGSEIAKLAFAQAILADAADRSPVIILGDFNLRESDEAYQLIAAQYQEAWLAFYPDGIGPDGLDMSGDKRIDHIFVSPTLKVVSANYLAPPASASDHPVHWAVITTK